MNFSVKSAVCKKFKILTVIFAFSMLVQLDNVFQVEELALNSMIRRANSNVHPQVKKDSKDSAKKRDEHKETEVIYFLVFSNLETVTQKSLCFDQYSATRALTAHWYSVIEFKLCSLK